MKHNIKQYKERYFIGIEYEGGITADQIHSIPTLWEDFMRDIQLLQDAPLKQKYIGLECYPPDFRDSQTMDYYAMVETSELIERDGFVSKRLPAGSYIRFEIEFDQLTTDIPKAYQYLKDHQIRYHNMFDYEDYCADQDYSQPGATLYISFLLDKE